MIGRLVVGALTVGLLVGSASPSFASDESEKICAEAQKRYEDMDTEYKAKAGETPVLMYKYNFCPKTLTVKKGTVVRWINVDKRTSHSVWLKEKGDKESERFFPDESWILIADEPGNYPYLCGPHWQQEGMKGTLIVK